MNLSQRIDIRQTQTLAMTPQLQQAIKLLQLSNQELDLFIEEQIQENPLLERAEPVEEESISRLEEARDAQEISFDELYEPHYDNLWDHGSDGIHESYTNDDSLIYTIRSDHGEGESDWGQALLTASPSLVEHIMHQLRSMTRDLIHHRIAEHLTGMLSPSGYLEGDLEELSSRLKIPLSKILETISLVQKLEPIGLFARSLAECMRLQLQDQGDLSSDMERLIENLDLVLSGNLSKLSKVCNLSYETCQTLLAKIRTLNPRPGLTFCDSPVETVVPDVIMVKCGQDEWRVELNQDTVPRVLLNTNYYHELQSLVKKQEDISFLAAKHSAGNWLIRSLQQRASTILRVASEIIAQQHDFFQKGPSALRPLVLREVALAVGMHESSISRVTNNKYIATPRGVFEFKYFFSASVANQTGSEDLMAAKAIQENIRSLIMKENQDAPLSDEQIVLTLKTRDIVVARRTVAKYREILKIGSSTTRRRNYLWRYNG